MVKTKHILQQPVQRRLPMFRPGEAFERWYGRPMLPHEYDIITTLESVRYSVTASLNSYNTPFRGLGGLHNFRHPAPRVLVIDPYGKSSVPLLAAYLSFLDSIDTESGVRQSLIVEANKNSLADFLRHNHTLATGITARRGLRYRGHTYQRLLMLNIQNYNTFSPFHDRPIRWNDLYRTLAGPLPLSSSSIVILHMTLPKTLPAQTRRLNHLSRVLPTVFNVQPQVLERTNAFIRAIVLHNRRLNTPVAVPLDGWPPDSGSRGNLGSLGNLPSDTNAPPTLNHKHLTININ